MGSVKHLTLRSQLRRAQQGTCCYCGVKMTKRPSGNAPRGGWPKHVETLEHLKRACEGGKTMANNVALACLGCNQGRGNVDWLTYASYVRGELAA